MEKNIKEHEMERNNGANEEGKEKEEKLMDDGGVVTPIIMVEDSNMSSEESPLEVHYTQDKTQEQFRRQRSLIIQAEFLFYIQIQVSNT